MNDRKSSISLLIKPYNPSDSRTSTMNNFNNNSNTDSIKRKNEITREERELNKTSKTNEREG